MVILIPGFYFAGHYIKQSNAQCQNQWHIWFELKNQEAGSVSWDILTMHDKDLEYWLDECAGWQIVFTLNSTNNTGKLSSFIVKTHQSLVAEQSGGYPEYAAHVV